MFGAFGIALGLLLIVAFPYLAVFFIIGYYAMYEMTKNKKQKYNDNFKGKQ